MVFSSFAFLFRFLPAFLAVYAIAPSGWKNPILFAGSMLFYASGAPAYLPLLLVCVGVNYGAGRLIARAEEAGRKERKRLVLVLTLCYDFGMLIYYKYTGLAAGFPLGISFYTFQISGYLFDVYRGKFPAEQSLLRLGTYLTMFSQVQSGPIVSYAEMRKQLAVRTVTAEQLEEGLKLLILGLGAKTVIADRIGLLWNQIQTIGFVSISTPLAWMGAAAYSLQLYFDFAGYSMMAQGIGRMLGFDIPKNFDLPYCSRSVTEFWRRWHITLGRWFREYVYIPLGGNRRGRALTVRNLLIVWSLTAVWHGVTGNYLIWGASLLGLMVLEKLVLLPYLEKYPLFGHGYLLVTVPLTWVMFAVTDVFQLEVYFSRLFPFFGQASAAMNPLDYAKYLKDYGALFLLGFLFASPWPARIYERLRGKWPESAVLLGVLAVSLYYLTFSVNNPFMYFSF